MSQDGTAQETAPPKVAPTEALFEEIVRAYHPLINAVQPTLKKRVTPDYRLCPNAKRGLVLYEGGRFTVVKEKDPPAPASDRCLVFVLESPHVMEFKKKGNPAPAQGTTGRHFDEALENACVLMQYHHKVFTNGSYDVWMVNAVRHQASLGVDTTYFRSIFFQIVWGTFGREDFKAELRRVIAGKKECIVVNACTTGNDLNNTVAKEARLLLERQDIPNHSVKLKNINLWSDVESAIVEVCGKKSIRASHPFLWDVLIYPS